VLLPDLALVVTLLGSLEDGIGFFKDNLPLKKGLIFFFRHLICLP